MAIQSELVCRAFNSLSCQPQGSDNCRKALEETDPNLAKQVFPEGVFSQCAAAMLGLCINCGIFQKKLREQEGKLLALQEATAPLSR